MFVMFLDSLRVEISIQLIKSDESIMHAIHVFVVTYSEYILGNGRKKMCEDYDTVRMCSML